MKKKAFLYSALLLVCYLVFMVVLMPADRLYGLVKAQLPASLYQIDGTIWHGRAAVATIGQQRLEALQWQPQPSALFRGRAQVAVNFRYEGRAFSATLGRGLSGLYLRDFEGSLTAASIEKFSQQLAYGLKGIFDIDLKEIATHGSELASIDGSIRWRGAGLEMNNGSLGNFELKFTTVDGKINGVIRDIGGPLKVNGTLFLQPSGAYLFAGTIELRDKQRNDLRQGLRFIGTPNPKGVYTIKHQGQLPVNRLAAFAG